MSLSTGLFYMICLLACVPLYILVRNECVFRFRVKLLREDRWTYEALPSYRTMMRHFWVWPLSRFLPRVK